MLKCAFEWAAFLPFHDIFSNVKMRASLRRAGIFANLGGGAFARTFSPKRAFNLAYSITREHVSFKEEKKGRERLNMQTWRRGSGEFPACGASGRW